MRTRERGMDYARFEDGQVAEGVWSWLGRATATLKNQLVVATSSGGEGVASDTSARQPFFRSRWNNASEQSILPVTASATSGRALKVLSRVPAIGKKCHMDRDYRFTSLGEFVDRPRTFYLLTSNDDRKTPSDRVMWTVTADKPATIYLNFRSERHVRPAASWLQGGGWELQGAMRGTVSSGVPNGPYSGPVYAKAAEAGEPIKLMGSNCWEGTYFVFVELAEEEEDKPVNMEDFEGIHSENHGCTPPGTPPPKCNVSDLLDGTSITPPPVKGIRQSSFLD